MKRFAFRLERLLQLREASEKERARELGQARREEEARRAAVLESEARLIEAREQFQTTPRELSQAGTLQNLELAMESLSENVRRLSETHEQSLERLEAERLMKRLVERRFGVEAASIEARLDGASLEQLEGWLDCIMDAPTLDALFGEVPQ